MCLDKNTLSLIPNDQHLVRIAEPILMTEFNKFIIYLGLTLKEWEDVKYQYDPQDVLGQKLMAMYKLKKKKEKDNQPMRLKDLSDALKEIDDPYCLCQVGIHLYTLDSPVMFWVFLLNKTNR